MMSAQRDLVALRQRLAELAHTASAQAQCNPETGPATLLQALWVGRSEAYHEALLLLDEALLESEG